MAFILIRGKDFWVVSCIGELYSWERSWINLWVQSTFPTKVTICCYFFFFKSSQIHAILEKKTVAVAKLKPNFAIPEILNVFC